MNLEATLRTIWTKYEPQREAERNAYLTQQHASEELRDFNRSRAERGLPMVFEATMAPPFTQVGQITSHWSSTPAPKTWRDDCEREILVAIKAHFEST